MNKSIKIIIVILLVAAISAIIIAKQQSKTTKPMEELNKNTAVGNLPKLVDLGASKCIPCKAMKPILQELTNQYKDIFEVIFIDVWENPDQAKKYSVNLIPTQIFYDAAGNELFRHEGFYSKKEILAKWDELGIAVIK